MAHRDDAVRWLHRLDSYTNAEFGRARTLCGLTNECVVCGKPDSRTDEFGLCDACSRRSEPDLNEIVLFRPMTKKTQGPS